MRKLQSDSEVPLPLQQKKLSGVEQQGVVNRLILVHQLSLILQTQLDTERLLRIMLSGITAGEALGFNRALVFLLDECKNEVVGTLGVGPINEEECRHVWQSIADRGLKLADFINEFGGLTRYQTAQLNIETQAIRWKIGVWRDLFTRTIEERCCFHVTPEHYEDIVPPPIAQLLNTNEMVTAPLVVTGISLGLVVADKKFSGLPITEEDVQLLSIVANQTAAALSHIRLFQELERFQDHLEERVREAVAEKEKAHAELIRRANLATVGEMAVTVAHEIRNPLTAVRGFAQRLLRKFDDPQTVHTYSQIIIQEVDRLNRVLGDVLDFARNVDAQFKPVNLNDLVMRSVELLQVKMGSKSIVVETDLDPNMPVCYYDGTQISQVLINLMKNGAEAMKNGGVLAITSRVTDQGCVLEITDTGCGIHPKDMKRVFTPFFTTKTRGTGLGLALARRIVEEHGGTIDVESEVDQGTTFRVILPIKREVPGVDEFIESLDTARPLVSPDDPLTKSRANLSNSSEADDNG